MGSSRRTPRWFHNPALGQRTGKLGPAQVTLPARGTIVAKISLKTPQEPVELSYTATNLLIAPGKGLPVTVKIEGP